MFECGSLYCSLQWLTASIIVMAYNTISSHYYLWWVRTICSQVYEPVQTMLFTSYNPLAACAEYSGGKDLYWGCLACGCLGGGLEGWGGCRGLYYELCTVKLVFSLFLACLVYETRHGVAS